MMRALALVVLLTGCADSPDNARITNASTRPGSNGLELVLTQQIELTQAMREALDHGIALRLVYRIDSCGHQRQRALWLRHAPLKRQYELWHEGASEVRDFARLSGLEAALDRVRLPLDLPIDARCDGQVEVRLDLAALPTPLRFPAFFQPQQWRLRSATFHWSET